MQVGIKTIFDIDEETFEKQDDDNRKQERINEEKEKLISKGLENTKRMKNKNIIIGGINAVAGTGSLLLLYPKALEMNDYALVTIGGIVTAVCFIGCGYSISQYEQNKERIEDLGMKKQEINETQKDYKKPRRLTK